MDNYFSGLTEQAEETEVWVDPLASSYEDMVSAIIQWVPDPRLLPDTND